ncbi:YheC/YheD family protein [Paenibacillus daejeonensis]|uniref:YheC/YheD family endospore coat-associated protein n=1 Tax=Paenibacillus daejeonensis TaxID=135193 RepID=UPI000368C999|nr:YheC/YheD family protein [Paenibacillus daejeonensis]
MPQPVLGILTLYLNDNRLLEERSIYQKMTVAGAKMGLRVLVFTPEDVNYKQHRIHAMFYHPETRQWTRKWTPFPDMIFDRCRIQRSYRFEQLKRFRSVYGHLTFLNRPLRNKWTVYKRLSGESRFRPYLPYTRMIEGKRDIQDMLLKYPLLYLKPINGTGGRGILRIERQQRGTWLIQGRDHSRRIIKPSTVSASALHNKLAAWDMKQRKYIIQQGIAIKLSGGRVHDYRMLVQKNRQGEWEVTGCAGRVGAPGSITSNLHGGGHAMMMSTLLKRWIGDEAKQKKVVEDAEQFSVQVAAYLEQSYGRLCELALDLAIDRSGQIWLLEVNPKPAREVFARAGDRHTYQQAIIKPLEYALGLYQRKSRRSDNDPIQTGPDNA